MSTTSGPYQMVGIRYALLTSRHYAIVATLRSQQPNQLNTEKESKTMCERSKHYYNKERNEDQYDGKTRTGGIMSDSRVPEYYKGRNGYEARKVCDNFDLSYHLATATTYILRAYRKHDTPVDCITKAIAHLEFELEKIKINK